MPKVTEKPKSATSSPSASTTTSPSSQQTPKLRSACDACHEAKVRCTGGNPCLHCKNHRLDCHYSYAARIGKPKGSRNRKTLARLREAGLLIGINNGGITSPTPSLGSSSPVSPSTADSAPSAWSKSDPLGYQTDSIPYGWTSTFTLPTPPDTGDYTAGCLNFQQDNITSHPATTAGSLVDPAAFHTCDPVWSQDTSLFTVSSGSTIHQQQTGGCSCFEWQTTKLVSLHTLSRTTPDSPDPTWPDHHNSGLSAACDVLLSCRKTLLCNYCDKDAAKVLLTVAAIQLALRRIEAAVLHTVKMRNMRILSSSSTASADSMAPEDCRLRHAISQAQDVVNDLRHVVVAQNVSVLSSPGAGYGMTVVEFSQPSANDTSYLHVTVSRLQTTIDRFNAMLG